KRPCAGARVPGAVEPGWPARRGRLAAPLTPERRSIQQPSPHLPIRVVTMRFTLSLLAAGLVAPLASAAPAKKPNILFIFADDQSYKTLLCYPESWSWVKSPNIDALAKSGVRFHGAYLGSWCMPSRASLLTGHHPHAIQSMRMQGKYPGSSYDPKRCPFWPALFRKNGYHTAQIGQAHTGTDDGYGRARR